MTKKTKENNMTKKTIILAAALCLVSPVAGAQGFLKKAKNALDKVNNIAGAPVGEQWKKYFDIASVTAQGDVATGDVLLTIVVDPKAESRLEIGGKSDDIVADHLGGTYSVRPLNSRSKGVVPLTKDVPRRYQMLVRDVPVTLPVFGKAKLNYYYIGNDDRLGSNMSDVDPLVFKNVLVVWDSIADTDIKAVPWDLKVICDVDIASCVGNKDTGDVDLTLSARPKSSKSSLALGSSGKITAFDRMGNEFAGSNVDGDYMARNLDRDIPTLYKFRFEGVDTSAPALRVVKIQYYANDDIQDILSNSNSSDSSPILLKNVQIDWR